MHRRATCDVAHCGNSRLRRQRLCLRCYRALPGDLRVGIAEAHHQRRWRDWQAMRRRAAEQLGLKQYAPIGTGAAHPLGRVTPERAFDLTARLLGERP